MKSSSEYFVKQNIGGGEGRHDIQVTMSIESEKKEGKGV